MINIYLTSWYRKAMTERCINEIYERTAPGSFQLIVYDNGSDKETRDFLYQLLEQKKIVSLILDSRNTGCLYNKIVFHAMTESKSKYYCINDADVYPPKLSPDWLSQMVAIMDEHTELALLAPQLPPQWLQQPYEKKDDIVYCVGVGNTLKLVRRAAIETILPGLEQKLGAYGDDGLVSKLLTDKGWKVAFCRKIFSLHAGQCDNWGYTKEQVALDPRKSGYGAPFTYELKNLETYEPEDKFRM